MQKPVTPTLAARPFKNCTAPRISGHQVMRLLGLDRRLAAVQIRHQREVAREGQPVGDSTDLIIDPPPLLDDDDCRRAGRLHRFRQITRYRGPIRPVEGHCCSHRKFPHDKVDRKRLR
jgi:hypothetical protein